MTEYVISAVFLYDNDGKKYVEKIVNNPFSVEIKTVSEARLSEFSLQGFEETRHVVVCGSISLLKKAIQLARKEQFSIGIIPLKNQSQLIQTYELSTDIENSIELSLRDEAKDIDLILCNDEVMLFKARVGRIPLIDNREDTSKVRIIFGAFKRLAALELLPFKIKAEGKTNNEITTAACGCILFANPERIFASRLISHDSSFTDGLISMVVVAPISIWDYFKLMTKTLNNKAIQKVPDSIGFIKSPNITIETENEYKVFVDGEPETKTPLRCVVCPSEVKINHGKNIELEKRRTNHGDERFDSLALPKGRELIKARNKKIPFFTYASEERFKDLFTSLKEDAKINSIYLTLMVISTLLATVGLYMNSTSVIIGAMLLAPLMAPIISLAMGVLRMDRILFWNSLTKIIFGILVSLSVSSLLSLAISYRPITTEMLARLNPTVLDLAVAIIAGIAGAYTKSYKEILQSLAGVAIAVALVPPLATAGIGLGRSDWTFFGNAFLLFSTNLIGIVLAATFTFRVLGFSPIVRDKKVLAVICLLLCLITVPLFLAYQEISSRIEFESNWKVERFLVNEKYLIIRKASLEEIEGKQILILEVLARDTLTRIDLQSFKEEVRTNFSSDLSIRVNITYIP